jgi:glycosyltransferase involved in cell wall biosynthesis
VLALRRLIKRLRPDLVHSYGWFSYSSAAALLGMDIPLLITGRDYGYSCARRTLLYMNKQHCEGPAPLKCMGCAADLYGIPKGWTAALGVNLFKGLLNRKLSGVHSISSYVQQIIERDFLGPQRVKIPQAVIPSFREDDDEDGPARATEASTCLSTLPREPFILFVGALRLAKGVKELAEAYESLSSPPPLVLIGTVEFDTPKKFPPGMIVAGKFPHQQVMQAWERCMFGVIPSLWPEPFGSVVYEGMSKGKAVIGTEPGGITDMIVSGETGLLVPAGDVHALAAAMQRLIDDPQLRERLGRAAKERAKLFTASFSVPRFEQVYRQLIDKPIGLRNEVGSSPPVQR